jgi:high-affinity Fe2+/Pb2+ permease
MATSCGLETIAVGFFISVWFLLRRRNAKKAKLEAEGATSNGFEDDRGLGFTYKL